MTATPVTAKPILIVLVGIPLSGKDTFIQQGGFEDFEVISRDEIIHRLGLGEYRKDYATISGN